MLIFNIWRFRKITLPSRSESRSLPCEGGLWRDARVVEWGGLENRCALWAPRVRIPVSPRVKGNVAQRAGLPFTVPIL